MSDRVPTIANPGSRPEQPAQPASDTTPRLALRPKDAARALGIGERKLWEITSDKSSGIPHVRIGKAIVYPVDLLREWLAEQAGTRGRR